MDTQDRLFGINDLPLQRTSVPFADIPLAARMRPRTLDEWVGQEHLLGTGSPLREMLTSGKPHSAILHGPPGVGKTTLARLIATTTRSHYEEASAIDIGKPEARKLFERATERQRATGETTVFFLDEIHRWNKAQQDALLPAVEEGLIVVIGATTENPHRSINRALLSRCKLYRFRALSDEAVSGLVERAVTDTERGLGGSIDADAAAFIARMSGGDSRAALGAVERAWALVREAGGRIGMASAREAIDERLRGHDPAATDDAMSAWIKSMRGGDVDAALYYLAVLIDGGVDVTAIGRRLVISAAEDVGLADPRVLGRAEAAAAAAERVGWPEARIPLAQGTVTVALAPASATAHKAIDRALALVRDEGAWGPPAPLTSAGRSWYESPHANRGTPTQRMRPVELTAPVLVPGPNDDPAVVAALREHRVRLAGLPVETRRW